jgi:phospholipid/cholesterol/gamma-HCH transport system substrate-binding protein
MESRREQALVGLFVLVASALLIVTLFLLSGTFSRGFVPYHAYFKNAGGLGPGTEVRYAGGPPVGRVQKVAPDPQDPTRMEVDFHIRPDVPIKTDSKVTIASTSPLGDNFLGILAGTANAPHAPSGSTIPSKEYTSFSDVTESLSAVTPAAKELLNNLNERAVELKVTLARVNDVLNDENRGNISGSLSEMHGILRENRPAIHSTINHLDETSAKLNRLMDDMKKTLAQANETLNHADAMITENRPDVRKALINLRQTLVSANSLMDQLDRTINSNSENLDDIIENVRQITDNLNQFTETIKTRPYSLIRTSEPKQHQPGHPPPQ